jgi:hypothetical protein
LERYALTSAQQEKAMASAVAVLDLAGKIQARQVNDLGASHAPGC